MKCYVYILYSEKHDMYYVGATNDVEDRLNRHNSGLEKHTKKYKPWKLVWFTKKPNKSEAFKLEKKLKNLSKERKKNFIEKFLKRTYISNTDEAQLVSALTVASVSLFLRKKNPDEAKLVRVFVLKP